MKSKLNILMVFSEVSPFAKTGGLGDVGGSLPKVLKDMGHDVRVITPQYRVTNERKYILRDVIRLQNIQIPFGSKTITVNVKSAFIPGSKVQVYFLDYKPFFFREGLYSDPKNNNDYPDNAKRFILFSRGVLETLLKLQWQPDVIHCNDWQTGLIPFFLKNCYQDDPFFIHSRSLFTIHNFAFQGNFNRDCLSYMGLDGSFSFDGSGLEFKSRCSFLKSGIVYADLVNTVSKHYSQEVISSSDFGFGMENLLKSRKSDFIGILNGIDTNVWDPEVDTFISEKYSIRDLAGKEFNKKALLEKLKLHYQENIPVVTIISRLTEQKGLDLIRDAFDKMMKLDIVFILLGVGDPAFHKFFKEAQKKYPDRVGVHIEFNESLAHMIAAGADIFLMPSKFEPCGLTQLYSLKYGTVPIVHETGGLADTVKHFNPHTGKGTGFVFQQPTSDALLESIKKAVKLYRDKKNWLRIIKNGMREDFSWQASAKNYVQAYYKCGTKKR